MNAPFLREQVVGPGSVRGGSLRFCMLTTFYPPYSFGGDAMGIQRLSQALVRQGHQVTVIQDIDAYNVLSPNPDPDIPDYDDGVEVVHLRSEWPKLSILLTQQVGRPVVQGRRIRRILEEREFDVIMFHNTSLVGGPGLFPYGKGIKLYMAHEHWLVCPSHVLWRHGRELCTERQCLRCVLNYRRPPQLWRYSGYLNRVHHHVDRFIAMSEFSRDKHREFGFPRDMDVVNYFLPEIPEGPNRLSGPPPHPRPYFLFVGRLEKIKGLEDTIPVFQDYPDADFLIAGDGEYAPRLRQIAKGIAGVKFLGRLAPDQLDRYYQHAIALIVPSVCFETFGIILIESFRQNTPVIARRIGPFPEIVERSGGGLLFDGPKDLGSAMRRIQSDPQYRERLARQGFQAFRQNWSEQAVIPRFLQVVKEVASTRGRTDIVEKLRSVAA